MDLSTGNSGNLLREAVIKIGPECQQEGVFCQYLGENVAPEVYAIIPNGYVMEVLKPVIRTPWLLRSIEILLEEKVWIRPALPISNDISWREKLQVFGIQIPSWYKETESCLVHGDPTISNALMRDGDLILCDPRPPRDFIPQCRETDMGRILQSLFGWESVAYGFNSINYEEPHFMKDEYLRKAALFWCGAAAARIEHLERSRENRYRILEWCRQVRGILNV